MFSLEDVIIIKKSILTVVSLMGEIVRELSLRKLRF